MNAGDTVALCRGGRWNITSGAGFANAKCSKGNTCDLRDYRAPSANGSEALPSIWINGGSNGATILTFSHMPAHHEGFRVMNLDLHGTTKDTAFFFWNETTNVDMCDLSMDGFNISVNMSGGDSPTYGIPSDIVLRGSRITNNSNIGYIAVCDRCSVEDNYFDNNGVTNPTTHSVYFASQVWTVNGQPVVHTTTGMRLSRNEIHHSTIQCNGAPVVVHGRHQDVVIENNIIDAANATDGCWGPGVGCGGYPYGCWFRNTIIRGNTFKNLGNVGSESNNCVGCLIENNSFTMNRSGNAITLGGEKPRATGDSSYSRWDGQPDDPTNNAIVRNNTIYFTASATSGKGIAVTSGTGHRLENNAIKFAVTTKGQSDNLCYGLPTNPTSAVALVDYNVCQIPTGAHWTASPPDYAGMTLAAWQTASGFDKHSKMTDPMFTTAPDNCNPASGSPLVNAGDAANSPAVDLSGKTRDSQPDIGAFEITAGAGGATGTGGRTTAGTGGAATGTGGQNTGTGGLVTGTGGRTTAGTGGAVTGTGGRTTGTGGVVTAGAGGTGVGGSVGGAGGASTSNPRQACAAEPLRSTGKIYYVCDCQSGAASTCAPGNDSNSGTTPSAPLQSFAKAASMFSSMNAGDTVALCRGGRWNITGGGGLANANCSKNNTCDFRDYRAPSANGSEGLPSIWINGGSNGSTIMTFSHMPAHQEGFRVMNLDLHGTAKDTALFFWNETTNVDLCDLSMDGFFISVNMSGGDSPTYGIPSNIVLRGSRITNNSNIGYIAVCDHCSVEDNYFDNNGVVNPTTHSVYFASQVWTVNGQPVIHTSTGMRLSRNEIHHSTIQCNGAPVVVHGRHQDVVIENNIIDAANATDGCWGPGVGCGGYPYGCWFRNTIIRGNTFKNLGNVGSESNNCVGCLIENNVFTMNRSGNAITLGGERPRAAGDAAYSRWDGQPDDPTNNAIVRNNTIYFASSATSGKGIAVTSGTGHTLKNNAVYFAATTVGQSDNLCYSLPANPTSALIAADYNICKIPTGAHWTSGPPDYAGMTLAAWQAASGFEMHSKMTDPMFASLPSSFVPAAGSPLVNAADATSSPSVDLNGKARGTSPDIGAFEY
jgi:hypothetical protein